MKRSTTAKSSLAIAAGALLVSAASGYAVTVSVLNHSFESPDIVDTVSNLNPTSWTVVEAGGADAVSIEARIANAGPTDGDQVLLFDDRNAAGESTAKQTLGTITTLGLAGQSAATFTFDARFGALNGNEAVEQSSVVFRAFWEVAGVEDTANQFVSDLGTGTRILRTASEIAGDTGLNMDTFVVTLDLTGVDANDDLTIGFGYAYENEATFFNTRTMVDNVRVEAVPEPSALALFGLAGAGLLFRRRR